MPFPWPRRSFRLARFALPLFLASIGFPSPGFTASRGSWAGDFGIPAFDGDVHACAILGGAYVVAGDFRWAAGVPASNVATWTGTQWAELGAGLPRPVRELALFGGRLVAATDNYTSGQGPVMVFDGSAWRPMGTGIAGEVHVLLPRDGELYAAGPIVLRGFPGEYRVVRWSGYEWMPVGASFDGPIRALAIFQGALYAGGEFLGSEDGPMASLARWNGSAWSALGSGVTGYGNYVAALEVHEDRLFAGGAFRDIDGVAANGIASWDGSVWQPLANPPNDVYVQDLQSEGPVLHVAGTLQIPKTWATGLATYDGAGWTVGSWYPSWSVEDIALGEGNLIAVGPFADLYSFPYTSSFPARDVVVRDATWHDLAAWKPTMRGVVGPSYTQIQALHEHDGELYAAGYFWRAARSGVWDEVEGIARWDGDQWNRVGDRALGWMGQIGSWGGKLVAAGMGTAPVYALEDSRWVELIGLSGIVNALIEWNGSLIAAGDLALHTSNNRFAVARYVGSGWEALGDLPSDFFTNVSDAAVFRGELFVAGRALSGPGSGPMNLKRWNGTEWVGVPGAPREAIACLLARHDGLWVGLGNHFTSPAGASSVWRWDGEQWFDMSGLSGYVGRMVEMDGDVFAAGAMISTTLASWDGSQWRAIPGAPEGTSSPAVLDAAVVGNDLYVGGWFTRVGGRQAEALALWRHEPEPIAAPTWMGTPSPTPARDRITLRFNLNQRGRVEGTLYDLRGARVAAMFDEVLPAGPHERTWLFASAGDRVRPGVYFARLTTAGGAQSAKVVIVP